LNTAERAQAYLQDEFFLDVVEKQRQLYISNIVNSSAEDVEGREMNYLKLRVLDEFIASIQSIADDKLVERKRWKVF
jgi:aminopeptidase C